MILPARFRRMLERLSRNVVLRRRLPADLGGAVLDVSPGASLVYWRGLHARRFDDLYDFAREHIQPGDVVWDIGANTGLLTFAAAHRVGASGRVLAFEPDWWSAQLLHRSRLRNRRLADRIQILGLAVADQPSLQSLVIPQRSRAASHLESAGGASPQLTGGARDRLLVPTVALDWVARFERPPSVIKIDVDGAEHSVLLGARALLESRRPRLLVEVHERNADAIGAMLHQSGYRLFSYESGEAGCEPITRPTYNTLALPA